MTDDEIAWLDLSTVARLIRQKSFSAVQVTQAQLRRIERLDPQLHAYARVTPELALAQARAALAWMEQASTEVIRFVPAIGPEDFMPGRQFHHPARPEVTYKLEERRVFPVQKFTANCASKLADEAQAELDRLMSKLVQTNNRRGDWCTEQGQVVQLYRELSVPIEMSAPTVPLKLRDPKLPKDEPQIVRHQGKRWAAIPAVPGDTTLMQAAVHLAQDHKCHVAYWDKNP